MAKRWIVSCLTNWLITQKCRKPESYHLIRDSMRVILPRCSISISLHVMAAIEEEPVRQPATLIPEAQPAPHQWQKMPFWQKVRPWAAQLANGRSACVSLAVIVGVQHYNGQSETSQPRNAVFNTLPMMGKPARLVWEYLLKRPQIMVNSSRYRSSVVALMQCCRITNCNADSTLNSFSLSRHKLSKPLYRCRIQTLGTQSQ